jgi:hypothetical protein
MRVPIGCFVLMAFCSSGAQTSQEFHSRYGESEIERFAVRPGIGLTVEFGNDGLACQELLELSRPILHHEDQAAFMPADEVDKILEEIAPVSTRGKETNKSIISSGCNNIETVEYENLSITRSTHNCVRSSLNRDTQATITFKRDACRSQRK